MNLHDINTLILLAFRYALGRKTYITSEVSRIVKENISTIHRNTLISICREIDHAIERNDAGMAMDIKIWLDLQKEIGIYLNETKD